MITNIFKRVTFKYQHIIEILYAKANPTSPAQARTPEGKRRLEGQRDAGVGGYCQFDDLSSC